MEIMDRMTLLVNEKKNNIQNQLEQRKINVIEKMINNPMAFFQVDANTIFGILDFLDVPKEEQKGLFFELISPEQFDKSHPKVRISTSDMK